jgi:IS30 family transposase
VLLHPSEGYAPTTVGDALVAKIATRPEQLRRSLTWEQGGLLGQYFPQGTNLSVNTARHLDTVAAELNDRSRKTLDWDTPAERMTQILNTTHQQRRCNQFQKPPRVGFRRSRSLLVHVDCRTRTIL